jgi:hypothetical protein
VPKDAPPDWAAWFENHCQYAETVLLESDELFQMFIAHARNGTIVPIFARSSTTSETLHNMARVVCEAYDAVALSCIGEAWVAPMSTPELTDYLSGASPKLAERRNKVEAVSVLLTYRLGSGERRTMASIRALERDESGRIVRLGDELAPPGWQPAGDVTELLPVSVTEAQRANAAHTLALLANAGAVELSAIGDNNDDGKPAKST